MNTPDTLAAWLEHIEGVHPQAVALGLDRVRAVQTRLGIEPACPVITVAGTNGKGSVCAYLEAALTAAGYTVGVYTSPHLLTYNERVRVAGVCADDAALCEAFARVEAARGDTPLTYFEFGTLAAVVLFAARGVDAMVLEVGLGGRLDAVNAFDADCAVLTSVGLDHTEYLGTSRAAIALEKAGVFRPGRVAVVGERDFPAEAASYAEQLGARLWRLGRAFAPLGRGGLWDLRVHGAEWRALPAPGLPGVHQLDNAACAVAALYALRAALPVPPAALRAGVASARLPGRFQRVPGTPVLILDVAHNPHAARALARNLAALGGRWLAVFSMLADKDVEGVVAELAPHVARWFAAPLASARAAGAGRLRAALAAGGADFEMAVDLPAAYARACETAGDGDKILAFGSFSVVAEILRLRDLPAWCP